MRGNRYGLADRMDLVVGRLDAHPVRVFGFVTPERPIEGVKGDVYIAAPNLKEALHGDRVVVRIEQHRDDGRVEGRIVQVLERRAQTLVGRFEPDAAGLVYVVPVRQACPHRRPHPAGRVRRRPSRARWSPWK